MFGMNVLEKDDWVLIRSPSQYGTEKGTAHAQHDLVGFKHLASTCQGYIREDFGRTKVLHDGEERVVVVIPLEEKFLATHVVGIDETLGQR